MPEGKTTKYFRNRLIGWSHQVERGLPWKNTKDPYKIWISEIILQQTRVAQGKKYYHRFIESFPDLNRLAAASEEEVLAIWKGLGYYSRARNLHASAVEICSKGSGVFPDDYMDILQLKGVGRSTAAAIASFAFNQPHAVLDGNVFRVLSRFFNIDTPIDTPEGKRVFETISKRCLDTKQPGKYNQAIMDLGATICLPKRPLCNSCPIVDQCAGHKVNTVDSLPVKSKQVKRKDRELHYVLVRKEDKIALVRREENDIWKKLYELPQKKLFKDEMDAVEFLESRSQALTHLNVTAIFYQTHREKTIEKARWVRISEIEKTPLPKVIDDFLKDRFLDD